MGKLINSKGNCLSNTINYTNGMLEDSISITLVHPPNFTPEAPINRNECDVNDSFVEPESIKPCVLHYVYIWPRKGRGFWAYLTWVGRRSCSGFRWNGTKWLYFGMDLRYIEAFVCY